MKSFAAKLLVLTFLADLFGVAAPQAAPDVHDRVAGYSQEGDPASKSELPDCSHACHAVFHFVALPAAAASFAAVATEPRVTSDVKRIAPVSAAKTYHPPRAL